MNDPFGWFQWAVVAPVVWFYYRWSCEGILSTIQRLYRNQVIAWPAPEKNSQPTIASSGQETSLIAMLDMALDRSVWTWLAVGVAVVAVAAQYWAVRPTELEAGLLPVWYVTRWSILVLEPMTGTGAYIVGQFTIRVLVSAVVLGRFFRRSELRQVFLVHPDGGGGFGALGRLAMRIALLAVLIGFWAAGITLVPVLFVGGRPNFSVAVLRLYMAYVVLVPSILFTTVWPAHMAMKRFKQRRLQVLSLEIQGLLDSLLEQVIAKPKTTAETIGKLDKLRELYVITTEIPEWPISLPEFKRFSGIALLPILTGSISFVIDLVKNWPF